MESPLPPIPAKRYFTIGEVGELCGVKPHVLRYWEQEFTQLRPMKRRGNRRYYQHHEVLMIRRIRDLLYDQGFTISGARNRMQELLAAEREKKRGTDTVFDPAELEDAGLDILEVAQEGPLNGHATAQWTSAGAVAAASLAVAEAPPGASPGRGASMAMAGPGTLGDQGNHVLTDTPVHVGTSLQLQQLRRELSAIRDLLSGDW